MKRRIFSALLVVLLLAVMSPLMVGCTSLSEEEKAVVGKYELIEVSIAEYPNVSASSYAYFTLDFKSNKKCDVASKAGLTTYEATASWKINKDGELEVITRKGLAKATEVYKYENDIISGTNTDVVEGQSITMTVRFKRIVE